MLSWQKRWLREFQGHAEQLGKAEQRIGTGSVFHSRRCTGFVQTLGFASGDVIHWICVDMLRIPSGRHRTIDLDKCSFGALCFISSSVPLISCLACAPKWALNGISSLCKYVNDFIPGEDFNRLLKIRLHFIIWSSFIFQSGMHKAFNINLPNHMDVIEVNLLRNDCVPKSEPFHLLNAEIVADSTINGEQLGCTHAQEAAVCGDVSHWVCTTARALVLFCFVLRILERMCFHRRWAMQKTASRLRPSHRLNNFLWINFPHYLGLYLFWHRAGHVHQKH